MKNKNISVNAVLNTIKSVARLLFPFITYPYALRILGVESVGKVAYSESIVGYFSLIAMLGIETYGVREGAKKKNNKTELQIFVNELFTVNIISTIFAYVLLISVVIFIPKFNGYKWLILLQSVSLIFTTCGMDWINVLHEDFLLITVRSIVIQVVTMVTLFLFVKTPNDYYIYASLSVIANGVICVSNRLYLKKYVEFKITFHPNFRKHLKPLLVLVCNTIAISIYVNFDTTMLGWIKGDAAVGYYSISVKIYTIIKNLLAAVYAVTIPRLSGFIGEQDYIAYRKLYSKVCSGLSLILIPAAVGLICVADEIIMLMGGSEFAVAVPTLQILSVALIFAIYGGLITAVLNITIGREKDNLIATIISALLNCGLNFIFIPLFSQNGAAITTVISEAFVFVFCLLKIKNFKMYFDALVFSKNILDAIFGSLIIVLITIILKMLIFSWQVRLVITIIVGACTYFGYLIMRKNEIVSKIISQLPVWL